MTADAVELLGTKKNVRVLQIPENCTIHSAGYDLRRVMGGLLVQDWDRKAFDIRKAKVVTKRRPDGG